MPPVGKAKTLLYPRYTHKIYCLPKDGQTYDGPLTVDIAKKLLRWESEAEYTARMLKTEPNSKETKWRYGEKFLFRDCSGLTEGAGAKINCWSNPKNRPFVRKRALMYAQDILNGTYRMNLEPIIVGCYGNVLSGQHRLTGLIFAAQEWEKCKLKNNQGGGKWEQYWKTLPYIETTVAYGCSEDPEVIRTLDNVMPRSLSDTIYTSPVFMNLPDDLARQECSRMMDYCVDCLFKRTKQLSAWNKFQTHTFAMNFADSHPRIEQCVAHIYKNNRDRVISKLRLSPGQSAAMLYLMGASATDEMDYHGSENKTETLINWANWDKALAFWNALVNPATKEMENLRSALQNLKDPHTGGKCRELVKQMVLSLAWNVWVDDGPITAIDLEIGPYLTWSTDRDRTIVTEEPTVAGIDQGAIKGGGEEPDVGDPDEAEAESVKKEKEAIRTAQLDEAARRVPSRPVVEPPGNGAPFTPAQRAVEVGKVVAPKKPSPKPARK